MVKIMKGINKVILIGNLGSDPISRYTAGGTQVVSFSLATSDSWIDKITKAKVEKTEWHKIVAYDNIASIAAVFLHKGSQVYVEGSLKYGKYTDKSGVDRYTAEIIVNHLCLLGKKEKESTAEDDSLEPILNMPTSNAADEDNIPF